MWLAWCAGYRARRGDACPFRKRKYVREWLLGVAMKRADQTGVARYPPTFRPRQQAEGDPRFPSGSSLGRIRRQQRREPLRRWYRSKTAVA